MVDAWASTTDVSDITGVTVTDVQLAQAQAAIEVFSGRMYPDSERLRARDLYWLGTRLDATQIQQDQVSTTLAGDGLVLAPMATRALRRVSWMRSRTIHVRAPIEGFGLTGDFLAEGNDDLEAWTPMGGGG